MAVDCGPFIVGGFRWETVSDVGLVVREGVGEFRWGLSPDPGLACWKVGHVVFREAFIDLVTFGFEDRATA